MNMDLLGLVISISGVLISIAGLVVSIISLCKIQKIIKITNSNDIRNSYNKINNKVNTKGDNNITNL